MLIAQSPTETRTVAPRKIKQGTDTTKQVCPASRRPSQATSTPIRKPSGLMVSTVFKVIRTATKS